MTQETGHKSCTVAVFAPSPVLTVTVEPGDETRPEIHLHPGGQGVWVSRMAASLGAEVVLCSPFGGESGAVLQALLAAERITVLGVPCHRANGAYVHDRRAGRRVTIAEAESPRLSRHEADELYDVALTAGLKGDVALLTGPQNDRVLKPDLYRRLAKDLRANGRQVAADLTGRSLTAALRGGVELLKVSDEELIADGFAQDAEPERLLDAIEGLHVAGAANVLVSCAEGPSLALVDGERLEIAGPRFSALDHRGAGDSMFAAIGVALGAGENLISALRLGVAAGALNATRHGLGTGHRAEIERLVSLVEVKPLGASAGSRVRG